LFFDKSQSYRLIINKDVSVNNCKVKNEKEHLQLPLVQITVFELYVELISMDRHFTYIELQIQCLFLSRLCEKQELSAKSMLLNYPCIIKDVFSGYTNGPFKSPTPALDPSFLLRNRISLQ
jgi:hypothetical protein